ncbi:MAG: GNAT family N-acetyltransferase [Flavobacteriaceae bacterium]
MGQVHQPTGKSVAMTYQLTNNNEAKQYEFHVDGTVPKIEYIKAKDKIYLTHTEVPKGLEGRGIGSALVKQALEDIEKNGETLVPLCPFVALYIKRHPEWKKLVLKGINIA